MNLFWKWLTSPAGRVLVGLVAFTYTTTAVGLSYPRAQTQTNAPLGPEYRVGPGDHIYLSVPQRPDLNRQLVVTPAGEVNLPLVGNVVVRGLNKVEIEAKLLQALREFYPSVNRVETSITQSLSNVIFVSGDVRFPGKYSFAETVNVWEAIREAGGPVPTATLSGVRVVQDRSRGGASFLVDVQAALESGSMDKLPVLKPGDTVIVPGQEETYTGTAGINVMGAVIKPGSYRLTGHQDLMSAVLMAGGPSDRANLSNVRLIRPDNEGRAETQKIDLTKFLEKGDMASNPKLLSGDTVDIGKKAFTGRDAALVLSFVTAIGTLVLLYYTIQNESSTSSGN